MSVLVASGSDLPIDFSEPHVKRYPKTADLFIVIIQEFESKKA
jgi:hypothetical protein